MAESPPKTSTPLSLYAEFLPKLGRISVVVHLPTFSTHKTKALISRDATRLIIYHDDITTELFLPAKTVLRGEHLPGVIPPGLDKMSWRLIPDQTEIASADSDRLGLDVHAEVWSATDLKPNLDVTCRKCDNVIITKDKLNEWKDLPSENWAEMMEFWHCHKPTTNGHANQDEKKAPEDGLASRGYGANSAILAQPGVGFVDLTNMLFYAEDCRCLTMAPENGQDKSVSAPSSGLPSLAASCPNCGTHLGHFDIRKGGVSLFKWKLDLTNGSSDQLPATKPPTLSQCLAAALVATQARSGSAKVILQGDKEAITIWILNPHIKFSCLAKQKISAMKLLYQDKAMAMEADEINLPDEVIAEVREILQEGSKYLPPDEKVKQFNIQEAPWKVALLER